MNNYHNIKDKKVLVLNPNTSKHILLSKSGFSALKTSVRSPFREVYVFPLYGINIHYDSFSKTHEVSVNAVFEFKNCYMECIIKRVFPSGFSSFSLDEIKNWIENFAEKSLKEEVNIKNLIKNE